LSKTRLFISTDMQMITGVNHVNGDKDDVQSLIHALMYQDKINIVGIASSTSKHQPGANDERFIKHVINAYGKDRETLADQADGFKTSKQMLDITYQGTKKLANGSGYAARTEASDAIIREARAAEAAGEKLYVATWGGLGDVARALHDAPEIAGSIRLLSASGPVQEPNAHRYIQKNFAGEGELWWIDARTTQRGIYAGPEGRLPPMSDAWAETNAEGHGALGDLFYANTQDVRGKGDKYDGVKMGDSFSVFYLIDKANNDDPTAESWGGEYRKVDDKYWVDRTDEKFGWSGSNGARTTYEDRAAWTSDFAKRFDWLTRKNDDEEDRDDEDDAPVNTAPVAVDDRFAATTGKAVSGNVLTNDRDAEGDRLFASLKDGPDNGKLKLTADGSFTYTPDAGFTGRDKFTYQVNDGDRTASANVTVTVTEPKKDYSDDPILARSNTIDLSSGSDQRVTAKAGSNSVFVDLAANSGSDRVVDFGRNDVLVLSDTLDSGTPKTKGGWLALDSDGDRIELPSVDMLRLLGTSDTGLAVYADASVRPSGAIEGTLDDDRLASSRGNGKSETFFFDTALGLNLGDDDILNFGERDQLVTTRKLLDGNGDGILAFGSNDGLDLKHQGLSGSLGHVRLFGDDGDQITSLSLERTVEQDGVSYFVYVIAE
jgi:VCBS repeat-containing protein